MYAACASVASARIVEVMPRPDFAFPLDETVAAIAPDTRVVYLTSPNNPTGVAISRDDIGRVALSMPPGGDRVPRRGLRRLRARELSRRARRLAQRRHRADVRQGAGARRRPGRVRRGPRPRDRSAAPLRPALQHQRVRADRDDRRARRSGPPRVVPRPGRGVATARLRDVRPPGTDVLAERGELRADPRGRRRQGARRRRSPPAASSSATGRTSPGAKAASASRRASSSTRSGASPRWRRSCAARGDRAEHDRDQDSPGVDPRRTRPLRGPHRHPLLRPHAGADDASRRVRRRPAGVGRPRRRPAPHGRGRRHRARRGRGQGARRQGAGSTVPATS